MTGDSGRILSGVLREAVRDVRPPGTGLADRARRSARRRRRHQVGAVAASGLALLALLYAPGLLPGPQQRAAERLPAAGVGPEVDLAVPVTAMSPVDMATGARAAGQPSVAWFSWRALHRSDGRVVQLPDGALGAVETPDGGALVTGGTVTDPTLTLVSADGRTLGTLSATPPVVGQDGQVAYVDLDSDRIVRIGADGWAATAPVSVPPGALRLVGFLGDAVVADTDNAPPWLIHRGGTTEPLQGLADATASDGPSGTVASRSADGRCLELRRDGRPLWHSCGNRGRFSSIVAISPNAHHVLLRRGASANPGVSEYAVVDSESGRVTRLLAAAGRSLGLGQAMFDTDHSVLVVAYRDAATRIVRCSLDGHCAMTQGPGGPDGRALGIKPFSPVWLR
jgi:hypothetical protein